MRRTETRGRPRGAVPVPLLGTGTRGLVWAAVGLACLQAAHLLGRPRDWVLSVTQAVDAYNFSMIFYGPAAAGLGAWAGRRHRHLRWLGRAKPARALAAQLGPALGVAWGVWLVALLAALAVTFTNGAPLLFEDGTLPDLLIAMLATAGYLSLGFAAGFAWPSPLVPAVAAAGAFGLTMWGWLGGWEVLLRFDGGSREPRYGFNPAVHLARLLTYGGVLLVGLALTRAPRARLRWPAVGAASLLLAAGMVYAQVGVKAEWRGDYPVSWRCAGSAPRVCIPRRYGAAFLEAIVELTGQPVVRKAVALVRTLPGSSATLGLPLTPEPELRRIRADPALRDRLARQYAALAILKMSSVGCWARPTDPYVYANPPLRIAAEKMMSIYADAAAGVLAPDEAVDRIRGQWTFTSPLHGELLLPAPPSLSLEDPPRAWLEGVARLFPPCPSRR